MLIWKSLIKKISWLYAFNESEMSSEAIFQYNKSNNCISQFFEIIFNRDQNRTPSTVVFSCVQKNLEINQNELKHVYVFNSGTYFLDIFTFYLNLLKTVALKYLTTRVLLYFKENWIAFLTENFSTNLVE